MRTTRPSQWAGSPRNQCGVFTIGRIMLCRLQIGVSAALIAAAEEVSPDWG